jgi:hypothetical protein
VGRAYYVLQKVNMLNPVSVLLPCAGADKKGVAAGASGFGESDLGKIRSSIQLLVQHTGPLGTCMDYIQEDVSLMTAELHRWEEECRK